MSNAGSDNNNVQTVLGVSNVDGSTTIAIKADPNSHKLILDDGAGGADLTGDNALRDANGEPTLLAVSNADNATPVPVYATAAGSLLTKST